MTTQAGQDVWVALCTAWTRGRIESVAPLKIRIMRSGGGPTRSVQRVLPSQLRPRDATRFGSDVPADDVGPVWLAAKNAAAPSAE